MDRQHLTDLLAALQRGEVTVDDAVARLRTLPYEDLGFAKLDHHRALRNGFPEVIFGEGKSPDQVVTIAERMVAAGGNVLITRLAADTGERLVSTVPGFENHLIFYRVTEEAIEVFRVLHGARDIEAILSEE